ncbi:MAG: hypothetical protein DLM59_03595 [Pseudonocardiales bacterium]|nr:MAG: hypothetical protein DLM59_03595 [Pseudonocardiales bacterium]
MGSGSVSRITAIGALCLAATFGVSACGLTGSNASKSDVVAALKKESDTKSLPAKQLDCLAGILIKFGNKSDVKKFADGKKKLNDVRQASGSSKTIESETAKCL